MIAVLGFRIFLGKGIWLPKKLLAMTISSEHLIKIIQNALSVLKKIKPWIHPRFNWICHSFLMEKFNGIMLAALGVFLALPLPIPLSNLTAAWAILSISIGIIEDDGLFVLIGYSIFFITAIFLLFIFREVEKLI